jgi:CheY-like chemotaxis protein
MRTGTGDKESPLLGKGQRETKGRMLVIPVETTCTEKDGAPALKIEQVALLCGVSVSRVDSWIEKNGLKVIAVGDNRKVRQQDLVSFLIKYNMPIPKGILPVNARKILLAYSDKRGSGAVIGFLRALSERIGKRAQYITDFVAYGRGAEYKILTFVPDLILADAVNADEEALNVIRFARSIGGMRPVALVRRNMSSARRAQMLKSGAHAVIERNSGWNELLDCLNRVFDSLEDVSK